MLIVSLAHRLADDAWEVLAWMRHQAQHAGVYHVAPDTRSYNAAIAAAVAAGNDGRVREVVATMLQEGLRGDEFTRAALAKRTVDASGGGIQGAQVLKTTLMEHAHGSSVVPHNTAMSAFVDAGDCHSAVDMLATLIVNRVQPDNVRALHRARS